MYRNCADFYRSKEWETFRKIVIDERTHDDGFVYCDECGKPILKKYDLILHHKHELDDQNVNDVSISLNENNIETLHFKCHNKRHNRFGFGSSGYKPPKKKVYIVYGSPCSGKTTWVHEVATDRDLVVDMDSIWEMVSINGRYEKPDSLKSVVFDVRDKLYDIIKYRSGKWTNAYIITGGALKGDRDRLKQRVGADDMIFINTSYDECIKRVQSKGLPKDQIENWILYITDWFSKYQAD